MRLLPAQRGLVLPSAPRAALGPASPHLACGYAHPVAACLLSHVTINPTRTRTLSSSPLSHRGLSLNPSPLDGGRSGPQPRSLDLAALPTAPAVAWPSLRLAAPPPPRRRALSLPGIFTLRPLCPQLPHASAGKACRATWTGPMPLTPLGWGLAVPPLLRTAGRVTRTLGPGARGTLFNASRHV